MNILLKSANRSNNVLFLLNIGLTGYGYYNREYFNKTKREVIGKLDYRTLIKFTLGISLFFLQMFIIAVIILDGSF